MKGDEVPARGISLYETRFGGELKAEPEFRFIWSAWRDERLLGTAWYCLLGRSRRESRDGGGVDLYVDKDVVDWVRVWKNGMVGGRERSS